MTILLCKPEANQTFYDALGLADVLHTCCLTPVVEFVAGVRQSFVHRPRKMGADIEAGL